MDWFTRLFLVLQIILQPHIKFWWQLPNQSKTGQWIFKLKQYQGQQPLLKEGCKPGINFFLLVYFSVTVFSFKFTMVLFASCYVVLCLTVCFFYFLILFFPIYNSRWQGCSTQSIICSLSPRQATPPCLGCWHVRPRVCLPWSHVCEHTLHTDHSDQ